MPKTPLTVRMARAKSPATWINEVYALYRKIEALEEQKEEYLSIIDELARKQQIVKE